MAGDLHLHTHCSDGNWSPAQLVQRAIELKFQFMALTDHDTVSGIEEAREAAGNQIELIPGIELNTIWHNSEGKRFDVHILGYFIDPKSASLADAMKRQQDARRNHMQETLAKFAENQIFVSEELLLSIAGKDTIGRPHLAQAMLAVGGVETIEDAYDALMGSESPYCIPRHSISPADAIKAIHDAGGVSSLAHPGKADHIKELVSELKECGLDALEAYHRSHSGQLARKYLKMASSMKMLVTGGSDCHGPWKDNPACIGSVKIAASVLQDLKRQVARG